MIMMRNRTMGKKTQKHKKTKNVNKRKRKWAPVKNGRMTEMKWKKRKKKRKKNQKK